jgi:hypothetical protein
MTAQQAFDALLIFGDKATAAGLFKTVGDAVSYKAVVDALVSTYNAQNEAIRVLNGKLEKTIEIVDKNNGA